ncbi:diguanylate cyclase [Microbulbifer sp. SAOS-129_SWC]|uniref:sensor domain-containing diguanylate cyclase n=1 Tax=Microbulbifer sp. SAOS-129_SWC TaxID=3145235 RepID=UPI0032163D09
MAAAPAAKTYSVSEGLDTPLGDRVTFLVEGKSPLSLTQATMRQARGDFQPSGRKVPSFGIGSPPVWFHLVVENPTHNPRALHLVIGKTWLDHIDVYQLQGGRLLQHWRAGDAVTRADSVVPGVGYTVPVKIAPGASEFYLHVQTDEPMVLSLSLLNDQQAAVLKGFADYRYGLLYGFLLAFIFYNLMLYLGLRDRSNLYYSCYLFCYLVLSLTYNGHASAWLWPQQPQIQRYAIMVMMLLFCCSGFLFACRFLQLELHAPRIQAWVLRGSMATAVLLGLGVIEGSQFFVTHVAFNFMAIFTIAMVGLGCLTISHGRRSGVYFLSAALCSMVGLAVTLFSVWGFLPITPWTFHSVELGLVLEAILFSLALASRVRTQEQARRAAEWLSRIDALTGLPNRRAFCTDATGLWSTAARHGRPLSLVMVDIDHFKNINDRHGHQVGDGILARVAQLLSESCREGDLVARWGGEEFVLLLPETDLGQACILAERIRRSICERSETGSVPGLSLTVSLGVAERQHQSGLDELIGEADQWMYRAKSGGRNRVCAAMPLEAVI